jgi:hypothetical protein
MAGCPYLTGLWTFRCLARPNFVIPSITEETRYCLGKHPEKCPHYVSIKGGNHRNDLVTRPEASDKSDRQM